MRIELPEILVILGVVLLIFGPTALPKLSNMFGKSVKSFKEGLNEADSADTGKENKHS